MLLWAAVQRDDVVLAEADLVQQQDINHKHNLAKLAIKILNKKPSPGWEHAKNANLKAAKLHLHQRLPPPPRAPSGTPHRHLIWSYSCVYANAFDEKLAKGFLEKLALMTDPLRETHDWLHGPALVAQDTFAPTLLQRMEQANSTGKTALISAKVNEVREIMSDNIELLMSRGEKLDELEQKATAMNKMSRLFRSRARDAKRFQLWQQAKFGLAVGTAVTVGVAIVVVPPVLAVL